MHSITFYSPRPELEPAAFVGERDRVVPVEAGGAEADLTRGHPEPVAAEIAEGVDTDILGDLGQRFRMSDQLLVGGRDGSGVSSSPGRANRPGLLDTQRVHGL